MKRGQTVKIPLRSPSGKQKEFVGELSIDGSAIFVEIPVGKNIHRVELLPMFLVRSVGDCDFTYYDKFMGPTMMPEDLWD